MDVARRAALTSMSKVVITELLALVVMSVDAVALGRRKICFPVKPRYDNANMTLAGV